MVWLFFLNTKATPCNICHTQWLGTFPSVIVQGEYKEYMLAWKEASRQQSFQERWQFSVILPDIAFLNEEKLRVSLDSLVLLI